MMYMYVYNILYIYANYNKQKEYDNILINTTIKNISVISWQIQKHAK